MNKKLTFLMAAIMTVSLVCPTIAAETTTTKDIPIGTSSVIEMIGTIEPTIMSVTMPSFVPFNISNSVAGQNKVISPRITVVNNSTVPLKVDVTYANVDMSKMNKTTWSDNGTVSDNQIAIGFKQETTLNQSPADLMQAKWLVANKAQDTNVLILNSNQTGAMYVVGTMGSKVAENSTFSVIPTFVVSRTSEVIE